MDSTDVEAKIAYGYEHLYPAAERILNRARNEVPRDGHGSYTVIEALMRDMHDIEEETQAIATAQETFVNAGGRLPLEAQQFYSYVRSACRGKMDYLRQLAVMTGDLPEGCYVKFNTDSSGWSYDTEYGIIQRVNAKTYTVRKTRSSWRATQTARILRLGNNRRLTLIRTPAQQKWYEQNEARRAEMVRIQREANDLYRNAEYSMKAAIEAQQDTLANARAMALEEFRDQIVSRSWELMDQLVLTVPGRRETDDPIKPELLSHPDFAILV
jgi:hypothetical protein